MNDLSIDKRDMAVVFRERMTMLIAQRGYNLSQFSKTVGVDRSALSQFLTPDSIRLPRAETLCVIAKACGVSLDWLMGMIANDGDNDDVVPSLEAIQLSGQEGEQKIAEWHKEAIGYKIRYVPCTIPDILRIEEVHAYEYRAHNQGAYEKHSQQAKQQLFSRSYLETDIEVCIAQQTLDHLANGEGIWSGLDVSIRRKQLDHMMTLIDDYYPTFRLFVYDQLDTYSSPYTLFGPLRAAIYLGNMYLVVNSVEHIKTMSQHFDRLIRSAIVPPDRAKDHISNLF